MGTDPIYFLIRVCPYLLLAAMPCAAQDLPDPGRRLTKEELEGHGAPKAQTGKPRSGPRDPQACERARQYYTISCGALDSRRSHSSGCGEAYALYRQACS
jgi:hypothetical protein